MKCNQICKWNSNAGCVKPYGVPCILENVSPTGRRATNADRFRAMSDEELAEFIQNMVDGSNSHNVACYGCINYGTHHSDPANKGTCLYECDGCENEGIGLDVLKWLQQPAEGGIKLYGIELAGWCAECKKPIEGRWIGMANFCPWCGRVIKWIQKEADHA